VTSDFPLSLAGANAANGQKFGSACSSFPRRFEMAEPQPQLRYPSSNFSSVKTGRALHIVRF
jgi:hypothetical protein